MIALVVVDLKNKQVNRSFDYIIPNRLEGILKVGARVKVPFGAQKRSGFVVGIKEDSTFTKGLKEIQEIIDYHPVLSLELLDLAKYIADEYFSFYATALEAMIPVALRMKYDKVLVLKQEPLENELLLSKFKKKKEIPYRSIPLELEDSVMKEIKNGNLAIETRIRRNRKEKIKRMLHILDTKEMPSSKKQAELFEYLNEFGCDLEQSFVLENSGYSKSVLDSLIEKGFVESYTVTIEPEEDIKEYQDKVVTLNSLQKKVYESVDLSSNETYLLHGVTGSGKTELYMRWIKDCIDNGKKALMLVPEISLTPQITAVFYARFKENIAVLHSRLSISEKYDEWKRIANGEVKIVVGARSAIFAPIDSLGIIIVDECHEQSYRQTNNPKYDAIDLAKRRAKTYGCPLVLGSATPNAEEYYMAKEGTYKLLELPVRANGKPLPESRIIDMRRELISGNKSPISSVLKEKMIDCYRNHEQSILFLNRRGYSSFVQCRSCGEAVKCPHCDVSLTYHGYTNTLKCHYCGYTMMNVSSCVKCGSDKIRFVGSGTEKIEEAVKQILPEAKVLRLDMDTVSKVEDYEEKYHAFKNHEADILIGTQMVTKGLDFEDVTLVGVLNADLAMHYPTFDANQIAFNLVEQVSGRCGRSTKDGEVVIQTYDPENYVILAAKNHDYFGFYQKEIMARRVQLMPPFSKVIELMVYGKDLMKVKSEANLIASNLRKVKSKSVILGPAEAFIFKKKDIYHYVIQIQCADSEVLDQVKYIYPLYQNNKDISISITRK